MITAPAIILVTWFTLTNHYMRGVDETDTYGWHKWATWMLSKYHWAVYSGLIVWALHGWQLGGIVAIGLIMGAWKGAEFTAVWIREKRLYWFGKAVIRGLYFLPLFIGLWAYIGYQPEIILAGAWCALMYAATSLVLNPLPNTVFWHKEAVSQTLFGLLGLGLPLAYVLGVINHAAGS